ncbi:TetR family transcriptional regulator [Mycobacterium sp. 1554424.7]|nr:TetR family transcriptional regulator [Mycobacterium sp. 1554424.7]
MVKAARRPTNGPRERLLDAAQLFYTEGIRAVGVNRLVETAKTPVMSLYRHFGSKEGLVEAFLQDKDEKVRAKFQRGIERMATTGKDRALAAFDVLGGVVADPEYRGCTFINVAVEMADPEHPFVAIAVAHKAFVRETFARYLAEAGLKETEPLATQLLMLMDGVFVSAQMHSDHEHTARQARMAAEALIDAALRAQADTDAGHPAVS